MKKSVLLIIFLICVSTINQAQDTIYVPQNYSSIQSGIDASVDGDIVLVDTGTYYENINFKGKAITVKSHYDPLNPDSAHIINTIIDGSQAANPDSASVVYFYNDEDTLSVLHGFTIQGGKGTKDMDFRAGGGITCFQAGPKIEYNRIRNNECRDEGGSVIGGGIDIWNSHNSIPIIRNNEISNNACYKLANGAGNLYGGGISVVYTTAGYECLIENNIISNNKCSNDVQDQYVNGGGIYVQNAKATIINNQIIGNQSISSDDYWVNWGAGICAYGIMHGSNISGNLISENSISSPWSAGAGLGIMRNSGKVYVDRNIFSNDTARRGGGVILLEIENEVVFTNNVLEGNYATYQGGGIYIWDNTTKSQGYPKVARGINKIDLSGEKNKDVGRAVIANNTFIENSDLSGNAASILLRDESVPLIAFNNIFYNLEGGSGREIFISKSGANAYLFNNLLDTVNDILCYGEWSGADNIVGDPKFEDENGHLLWSSPCIGAGLESIEVLDSVYYCSDHDMDGDERPQKVLVDIGSDETPFGVKIKEPYLVHNQIRVYPNPASDIITLEAPITIILTSVDIIDINGKIIIHKQIRDNNLSYDISHLPKGIFFIRINTDQRIEVKKLIIQ